MVLSLLLIISCRPNQEKIRVEGRLSHAGNEKLYLSEITPYDIICIDSVFLQNGNFAFTVKNKRQKPIPDVAFYRISLTPYNHINTIIHKGEKLYIEADSRSMVKNYSVSGGKDSGLMHELDETLKQFIDTVDILYAIYAGYIENDSARMEIENTYNRLLEKHEGYLKQFISRNPSSLASVTAFYQTYNKRRFIDEKENLELLKHICSSLKNKYPHNENVSYLEKRIRVLDTNPQGSE